MSRRKRKMTMGQYIDYINEANERKYLEYNSFAENKERLKELCYKNTYNRLYNIVLKEFKWNVPDTMNPRIIELGYIQRGAICVYKDNNTGDYALPCIANNMYNIYGDPTQVNVFGYNGYHGLVDIKYSADIPTKSYEVPIKSNVVGIGVYSRDNDLAYPYINYIEEYASKISDKLIALNIATQKLKSPFRFAINDIDMKETAQMMCDKIESNDDIVIVLKGNKLDKQALDHSIHEIGTQINPANIQAIKDSILFDFNMFLETMGINTNPSPDKSQVVLTPELNSNNGLIDLEQDIRFMNRQKLCDDVKKILGITMSVEKNLIDATKEFNQLLNNPMNKENKEDGTKNEKK